MGRERACVKRSTSQKSNFILRERIQYSLFSPSLSGRVILCLVVLGFSCLFSIFLSFIYILLHITIISSINICDTLCYFSLLLPAIFRACICRFITCKNPSTIYAYLFCLFSPFPLLNVLPGCLTITFLMFSLPLKNSLALTLIRAIFLTSTNDRVFRATPLAFISTA